MTFDFLTTFGRRRDKYHSFLQLISKEVEGVDFRIEVSDRPSSKAIVIAPHGGGIEPGTSEIARRAAGNDFSFYLFEGTKRGGGNRKLHITSHNFDEPTCLELVGKASVVVAVHGCKGPTSGIHIGGLDQSLKESLGEELSAEGLPVVMDSAKYPASDHRNICNRGTRQSGAQLEITRDLRKDPSADRIARAIRRAIEAHHLFLQSTA